MTVDFQSNVKQLKLHLSIKKLINWIPQTTDQFHSF